VEVPGVAVGSDAGPPAADPAVVVDDADLAPRGEASSRCDSGYGYGLGGAVRPGCAEPAPAEDLP